MSALLGFVLSRGCMCIGILLTICSGKEPILSLGVLSQSVAPRSDDAPA